MSIHVAFQPQDGNLAKTCHKNQDPQQPISSNINIQEVQDLVFAIPEVPNQQILQNGLVDEGHRCLTGGYNISIPRKASAEGGH